METEMTTKQQIIYEALRLFSLKGYDGIAMREIAAAVGIKGASLYNHFKGKEDIFKAIFEEMKRQFEATKGMEYDVSDYKSMNQEELLEMAESIYCFFSKNEFVSMFRRMLVSEQFKSQIAAQCYKQYYIEEPLAFQSKVFMELQNNGIYLKYKADDMALHFYSPILFLLNKYDLGYAYEECLEQLKSHVISFCKAYNDK